MWRYQVYDDNSGDLQTVNSDIAPAQFVQRLPVGQRVYSQSEEGDSGGFLDAVKSAAGDWLSTVTDLLRTRVNPSLVNNVLPAGAAAVPARGSDFTSNLLIVGGLIVAIIFASKLMKKA